MIRPWNIWRRRSSRKSVSFEIAGSPQSKTRPRVVRAKNGANLTYMPDKTVAYEELVRLYFKAAAQEFRFTDDAQLTRQIVACYPVPKSKSKRIKAERLSCVLHLTKKLGCDNIVKIICDALNELAYKDDSQIATTQIAKYYAEAPRMFAKMIEIHCTEISR